MTSRRFNAIRLIAALALTVLLLPFVQPSQTASANSYEPITGSGSTWSQNALDQWRRNVANLYGMQVNYNGTGSSAGRTEYINGTIDYAISEIPFQAAPEDGSTPERPPRGYAYMPIVAGGTAFMYNLNVNGRRVDNLRLSGDSIAKIFTGVITNWSDPQLQGENPGIALPNKQITPVYRSDGSGSTAQFTTWLSKQHHGIWAAFCASVGKCPGGSFTSQYPQFGNAKGQNGSSGVSGYVAQDHADGAITYVEYSYPKNQGFPVALVLNSSGYYTGPQANQVAVALTAAQINQDPNSPDYLTQILDGVYNNADQRSYPLSSYSYMIVPTEVGGIFTAAKGNTLAAFANYMVCEGQRQANALGYSPLPMNLVLAGFTQITRIPGSEATVPDANKCNNPTFKPGDSPENNQLAATTLAPLACNAAGGAQCTKAELDAHEAEQERVNAAAGTGGDGVSGGAGGAGGSGAGAGAGGAGTGANATAAGNVAAAAFDEYGNPIGGGTGVGGAAIASPFTLATGGWGGPQTLMLVAGMLLLAAMLVPPALWSRLGKGTKGAEEK